MTEFEESQDKIIDLINQLPPMPDNIIELRRLCADPNTRFKDFIPLIENDPGLCADILHMANSVYFGVDHTVENIGEAVRYFGMNHLVDFLSVSFSEKVVKEYFSVIRDLNNYFHHSRVVSIATKTTASTAGKNSIEQQFFSIAGLLHDIGRLVLILVSDERSAEMIGSNWMYIEDQIHKEESFLGVDHTIVGEKICDKWEFSEALQKAVRFHHVPFKKDDGFYEEAAFIFISHFISMLDFPIEMVHDIFPENILVSLGLSKEKITQSREAFITEAEEIGLKL